MSLPEYVTFYDRGGRRLYSHFVNVGWVLSRDLWIDTLFELPHIYGSCIISCYDIKVAAKWVYSRNRKMLEQLWEERQLEEAKKKALRGKRYFHREPQKETSYSNEEKTILLRRIRSYPQLLAEDIIGVQPMNIDTSSLFKFKYIQPNKYKKILQQIKHKLDYLKIFIVSCFRYYTIKLL